LILNHFRAATKMVCLLLKHLKKPFIDSRNGIELSCQFAMACLRLMVSVVPLLLPFPLSAPNVERDAEVVAFLPDLVIADRPGKAFLVGKGLVGINNALEVVIGQHALRPLAGEVSHGCVTVDGTATGGDDVVMDDKATKEDLLFDFPQCSARGLAG